MVIRLTINVIMNHNVPYNISSIVSNYNLVAVEHAVTQECRLHAEQAMLCHPSPSSAPLWILTHLSMKSERLEAKNPIFPELDST